MTELNETMRGRVIERLFHDREIRMGMRDAATMRRAVARALAAEGVVAAPEVWARLVRDLMAEATENRPEMIGGHRFAYGESMKLREGDPSFYALLMAAMRKADPKNAQKLRAAFPFVWAELQARYDAPGGLLESER